MSEEKAMTLDESQWTYDSAVEEIERILNDVESNALPVEDLARAIEKSALLLAFCKRRLRATETKVEKALAGLMED